MSKNTQNSTNLMKSAAVQRTTEVISEHEVMRIATPEHRATFRAAIEADGRCIPALAELLKTTPNAGGV